MNDYLPKNSIDLQSSPGSAMPIGAAIAAVCPPLQELGFLVELALVKITVWVMDAAIQAFYSLAL